MEAVQFKNTAIRFIEKDELKFAIRAIEKHINKVERDIDVIHEKNNLILTRARLIEFERKDKTGSLNTNELSAKRMKIREALLWIVDTLTEKMAHKEIYPINTPLKKSDEDNVILELNLNRDLSEFTIEEKNLLLEAINTLLNIEGTIKINKITRGSIKIKIELSDQEAKVLVSLINTGALKRFDVSNAHIIRKKSRMRAEGNKGIARNGAADEGVY